MVWQIQLRIRDRIQTSVILSLDNLKPSPYLQFIQMEQFSRECLEIDTHPANIQASSEKPGIGSSMDKVYDRAAKLVKRTLDVEGVMVMGFLTVRCWKR